MNFSIIIPLFNEEKNIKSLIDEIILSIPKKKYVFEIILVNDCSTDNTLINIKKIQKNLPNLINIIKNNKNIGQSYSLIKGIKSSKYNNILTIDGDGQNNPLDIPKLLDLYFSKYNFSLVAGIRKRRRDTIIKIISSRIANKVRNFILKDNCSDTGCSLKIFDKRIFQSFPEFNSIHRFLPALFNGYGNKIKFIDVDHRIRKYGVSSYGTLDRLYKGIFDMLKVYRIINNYKMKK
tara:strand:+ start:38 stop:742 length:705 start_codon:yes stop_codon:yes gene_type:complete